MTDLRTAAQQALEAMQSFESGTGGLYAGEFAKEIADLRAALADQDRGWYTIDEINAKFDPELVPRRDDMNRWEAEIDSWRQRYEALLKTVADHESLAPPMMLADKQSYELGLLHGAAAEREACARVCEETDLVDYEHCMVLHTDGHATLRNAATAIRARGNT